MKISFSRLAAGAIFISAFLLVSPVHASALSGGQIQAIIGLLESFNADPSVIAHVQAELGNQDVPANSSSTTGSSVSSSSNSSSSNSSCVTLSENFGPDAKDSTTNGEVSKLQQFLGVDMAGHFGPATLAAVELWQSTHGIVSSGSPSTTGYGYIGPKTRAAMACSAGSSAASQSSPMIPTSTSVTQNSDSPYSHIPTTPPNVSNSSNTTSATNTTNTYISAPAPYNPNPTPSQTSGNMSASIDQISVGTATQQPSISGHASGVATVTVGFSKNGQPAYTGTASVSNGVWALVIPSDALSFGTYALNVSAPSGQVLARGTMTLSQTTSN